MIEFVRAASDMQKDHNRMKGMYFSWVNMVINWPNDDKDMPAPQKGAVVSSTAASPRPSPGFNIVIPPQAAPAQDVRAADPRLKTSGLPHGAKQACVSADDPEHGMARIMSALLSENFLGLAPAQSPSWIPESAEQAPTSMRVDSRLR